MSEMRQKEERPRRLVMSISIKENHEPTTAQRMSHKKTSRCYIRRRTSRRMVMAAILFLSGWVNTFSSRGALGFCGRPAAMRFFTSRPDAHHGKYRKRRGQDYYLCNSKGATAASSSSKNNDDLHYKLVENHSDFLDACQQLEKAATASSPSGGALAFDIECEFNLHRYGEHLCLIQISDGKDIFIIDPTTICSNGDRSGSSDKGDGLDPLWNLLESPDIPIIWHSPGSDVVLLNKLYGLRPKNIFDTEMAARLLGYQRPGLSVLLETHFGQTKQSSMSKTDWFQRPLTKKMLEYAALDVAYLHELRDVLFTKLGAKNRLDWHAEECLVWEAVRYVENNDLHLRIKGSKYLERRELHVLKYLFTIRDHVAQELDKPAYWLISNKQLLELAQKPPKSVQGWKALKGVHPRVRTRDAYRFHQAITDAKSTPAPPLPETPADSETTTNQTTDVQEKLDQIRSRIQADYPDVHQYILSKDATFRIATGKLSLEDMREWRRSVILQTGQQLNLDVSGL